MAKGERWLASIAARARVSRAARMKRRPCLHRGSGTAAKASTSGGERDGAVVVAVASGDNLCVDGMVRSFGWAFRVRDEILPKKRTAMSAGAHRRECISPAFATATPCRTVGIGTEYGLRVYSISFSTKKMLLDPHSSVSSHSSTVPHTPTASFMPLFFAFPRCPLSPCRSVTRGATRGMRPHRRARRAGRPRARRIGPTACRR